eukprot:TRINITY_DN195_c0_g2_i1.p1 TRINITY_DN195_c0_g2~~TRINITY_DN195_c0_g2_i1.p1  ORF type:complete len:541 (-),score=64.48 TRINITY_DN195_c0_g2_i1:915-2537(-)
MCRRRPECPESERHCEEGAEMDYSQGRLKRQKMEEHPDNSRVQDAFLSQGAAAAMAYERNSRNANVLPCTTGQITDDFILKDEELGRGQFGIIRVCIHRATGAMLACKSIAKDVLQKIQQIEALKTEIAVMAFLDGHPNIVEHVGVYEDSQDVHVVMELCRGGDLFDLIKQAKRLQEVDAAWLFRKIVGAVGYCHQLGLVHRDLKPENILVAMDGSVEPKLADFGLSMVLGPGQTLQGLAGSPSYMAPEVIWGQCYDTAADIWSLGVILYFMLSGFLPFYGKTPLLTFAAVCRGELDLVSPPWTQISYGAKALIRSMLSRDPARRPTASEILLHPWLLSFGPPIPCPTPHHSPTVPDLPSHDLIGQGLSASTGFGPSPACSPNPGVGTSAGFGTSPGVGTKFGSSRKLSPSPEFDTIPNYNTIPGFGTSSGPVPAPRVRINTSSTSLVSSPPSSQLCGLEPISSLHHEQVLQGMQYSHTVGEKCRSKGFQTTSFVSKHFGALLPPETISGPPSPSPSSTCMNSVDSISLSLSLRCPGSVS